MDWTGRRAVVTGAGGFIGSHLTERLLGLGAQVVGMVHGAKQGHLGGVTHRNLEIAGGDLCDGAFVSQVIAGADTVFHLGAVTSVAYSYQHPEETVRVNTLGTLHVCVASRMAGVRRLVHTSTAGVYGNALGGAPIRETHPVSGCNPYTAGKLGGDFVAQTYHLSYGLPVATIRLFNTYGPRVGEYLIIPTIIKQLLAGPRLRLGDLRPVRSFVYVDDVVDAFLLMGEREEAVGELVHFGGDTPVTMRALAEQIASLMGVSYELERDASRFRPEKSEIFTVMADTAKARQMLGWAPKVGLEAGLRATIAWFRELHAVS